MASEALASRNLKPLIGAEVLADKAALLGGAHAGEIRELLEMRGVLVFPQVHFSEAEHIAFTETLGTYAPDTADGATTAISLDPDLGANADYTRASFFWHFDGYMNDVPVLASLLCARMLAPEGGDTEFANTYAAYDALPDDRKAQLEGLSAAHALAGAQRSVEPEPSYASSSNGSRCGATPCRWCGSIARAANRWSRAIRRWAWSAWTRSRASTCWSGCATGRRRSGLPIAIAGSWATA